MRPKFTNTRYLSPVVLDGITQAPAGTYEWHDWWEEQRRRCIEGYSVGDIHITGEHYFYLNFWKILRTPDADSKSTSARTGRKQYLPPRFIDIDYDFFWAWQRAKDEEKDLLVLKRRQTGFSNKYALLGGYEFTFFPDSYTAVVGATSSHANGAFGMVRKGLDNLAGTEFFKKRETGDSQWLLRASFVERVRGQKTVSGYMSEVQKFISDGDPQTLIGKSPSLVILEEVGKFPGFLSVKEYIEPGMTNEGKKTGWCLMVGTGGEANDGIEELRKAFYHPARYNILETERDYDHEMPFEDFSSAKSTAKTALFFPGYKYELMDKDGNSLIEESVNKILAERKRKEGDEKRWLEYVTQIPLSPEEALLTPAGSRFNIKKLRDQLIMIRKHGIELVQTGELEWIKSEKGAITGIEWVPDPHGRFRIVEHPIVNPLSKVPHPGLYVAGTDSYDRDNVSTKNKNGSFGSCYVYKRFLNADSTSNIYVGSLYERPDKASEFYEDTAKLCYYFNAMNLVEYSNLLILEWYRQNGFEYMLKERPEIAYAANIRSGMENKYGIDPSTKAYWIQSMADYIEDHSQIIWDPEHLEALINYREDDKDYNCDRTVASSLCVVHNNDLLSQQVLEDASAESGVKRQKFVNIGGRLKKVYA